MPGKTNQGWHAVIPVAVPFITIWGNLNLTFIENSNQIRSSVFTESIIRFLEHYGLHARSDERQADNRRPENFGQRKLSINGECCIMPRPFPQI